LIETALRIAVVLLVPFAVGAACLRVFGHRRSDDALAWPAWSYVTGALVTGGAVASWAHLGLPLRAAGLVPALVAVAAGAFLLSLRNSREPRPTQRTPWPLVVAVAALAAVTIDRLAVVDARAVIRGDEAQIWAAKAKVLFHLGRIDERFGENAKRAGFVLHPDYPALNPLLQVWAFVVWGGASDVVGRIPIQAFTLAVVFALAGALRRTLRPGVAAACLGLGLPSLAVPPIVETADSDVMVALGLLLAFDAWTSFAASAEGRDLARAAIGLALAAGSKHEGELLAVVSVAAGAVAMARDRELRRRLFPTPLRLSWLALPAAAIGGTWLANFLHGFSNDLVSNPTGKPFWVLAFAQLPDRAAPVARAFAGEILLDVGATRLVLLAFLATCVLAPRVAFAGARLAPALALLLAIGVELLVFVGSYAPLEWHLSTALLRVFSQLVPAASLVNAQALATLVPRFAAPA